MWFRNARPYKLPGRLGIDASELGTYMRSGEDRLVGLPSKIFHHVPTAAKGRDRACPQAE